MRTNELHMIRNEKFDATFKMIELEDGVTVYDIHKLADDLNCEKFTLLEIECEYCVASGFISLDMADKLDYDVSELIQEVNRICNDVNNETMNGEYTFTTNKGIEIKFYIKY